MIIKSLSCKASNPFGYLIDYFHKVSTERSALTHNLISSSAEDAKEEMSDNLKYISRRRNNNQAYHEILSLKEDDQVPIARQAAMLEDMARFYINRRAPKCLAYGVIHHDRKHLHMHIAISANAVKSNRRHSLSKANFRKAQQEVEAYRLQTYPELGDETYYDKDASFRKQQREADNPKLTDREYAMKSRTGQFSNKEQTYHLIKSIFETTNSETELKQVLKTVGFEIYRRGNTEGVKAEGGRKYRLKTLGLEPVYQTVKKRHQFYKSRLQEITWQHVDRSTNRERS